jgi:hypothetical protein
LAEEKDIARDMYMGREVGFVIYDRVKNSFIGNIAYMPATWKPDYEDR